MANETKALVTAETQGAAEFCACQTVHCAIYWAVWRAAVGSFDKKKKKEKIQEKIKLSATRTTNNYGPIRCSCLK